MEMTRRSFIVGGSALAAAVALGGCLTPAPWATLLPWTHSWDAADPGIGTYSAGDEGYGLTPATRVASIPDPSGGRPMLKDTGAHMGLFLSPPAPGPIFHPSHPSFAGRAAWESDTIIEAQAYFDNFHSMLSPLTDKLDQSQWLGWEQPWWGAVLVAPHPDTDGGPESVALDGDPGMTTIELVPTVNISTWNSMASTGPYIRSDVVLEPGQPAMIAWQVNGPNSWLEVTHRRAGAIVRSRFDGGQGGGLLDTLHSGWSNENLTSCIGLKRGLASDLDATLVSLWSQTWL